MSGRTPRPIWASSLSPARAKNARDERVAQNTRKGTPFGVQLVLPRPFLMPLGRAPRRVHGAQLPAQAVWNLVGLIP